MPTDAVGVALYKASQAFALGGGLILTALTLMSLASIVGRAAFSLPLPGDYELVQLGCAVSVAAFLPYCQMRGGHVLVDFFTANVRASIRATLDALGAALLAIVGFVFAWRLTIGAIGLREANDQSTILAIPTWWTVSLMVPSFALLGLVSCYTAWRYWHERRATGPQS
jgi:TRAP-type C4-dicarboxylate transport system permease small subunit